MPTVSPDPEFAQEKRRGGDDIIKDLLIFYLFIANSIMLYSGTPVTRPTMGPMSGGRVSEVENLGVNFLPKNCVA
jgi:hypothetical protein